MTLDRPGASPMRQVVDAPADGSRPVVTFRVPMDEVGHGRADGRDRTPRRRRPARQRPPDRHGSGRRRQGQRPARRRRGAVGVPLPPQRPGPRPARRARGRRLPSAADREHDHADLLEPRSRPGPKRQRLARTSPTRSEPSTSIIIGDVDPADVTPETWARLETYVAERGGTLVLSPGPRHWAALGGAARRPASCCRCSIRSPSPSLPTAIDAAHPELCPRHAGAADACRRLGRRAAWPMLQLASEPEQNLRIWSGLPRLPWVLAGRAKPGATVLATAREVNTDAEADPDAAAVIAAQPYGLGKVLWVGTDGTWRWRHRVGDAYHHRFWGQVVRWAAASQLAAGNALRPVRADPAAHRRGGSRAAPGADQRGRRRASAPTC